MLEVEDNVVVGCALLGSWVKSIGCQLTGDVNILSNGVINDQSGLFLAWLEVLGDMFVVTVECDVNTVEVCDKVLIRHPEDAIVCNFQVHLILSFLGPQVIVVTEFTCVFLRAPWVTDLGNGVSNISI